jgi:lipopolysaccharide/colanic/teichoic acid biosynthesis glycosyltransferase
VPIGSHAPTGDAVTTRLSARPLYNLGTVVLVVGAGWLHAAHLAPEPYAFVGSPASRWLVVFTVALVAIGYAVGLPELAASRTGAALRGLGATVAAFGVISAFQAVLATPLLPRSSSMLIGLIQPVWTVLAWNLANDADRWAATRDRVFLVVDRIEDHASLVGDLADRPEIPARVVGWLTLDEIRRAGADRLLERLASGCDATILVLDTASQADPSTVDQAAVLHRRGVRIRTLSLFYEHWIGKLPHAELARVSLLFDIGELHRARYVRLRRLVDLAFAGAGLVALAPLVAVVAVLNPLVNRGPLLFRQTRVGRGGVPFEMIKLRTMVPGDPSAGGSGAWTEVGDHRITPLGGLLRRTHLDELPQVVNIVRGDLSLVGPRPEQPHYVEELSDKIAFYDVRHIVRPGLTGWAQVKQGYAADHGDAFEKLQYDFYYLRRQGLALDAKIVWRTVRGIVAGAGR